MNHRGGVLNHNHTAVCDTEWVLYAMGGGNGGVAFCVGLSELATANGGRIPTAIFFSKKTCEKKIKNFFKKY